MFTILRGHGCHEERNRGKWEFGIPSIAIADHVGIDSVRANSDYHDFSVIRG